MPGQGASAFSVSSAADGGADAGTRSADGATVVADGAVAHTQVELAMADVAQTAAERTPAAVGTPAAQSGSGADATTDSKPMAGLASPSAVDTAPRPTGTDVGAVARQEEEPEVEVADEAVLRAMAAMVGDWKCVETRDLEKYLKHIGGADTRVLVADRRALSRDCPRPRSPARGHPSLIP